MNLFGILDIRLSRRPRYVSRPVMIDKQIDAALMAHRESTALKAVNEIIARRIEEATAVIALPDVRASASELYATSGQLEALAELRQEIGQRSGELRAGGQTETAA